MKFSSKTPALLVLADGTVFKGNAAGKKGTATGEICFNTGMTGYQEVFTDPSYYGQILIETNVHIGNYGIRLAESESDSIKIAGLVCKSFHAYYSRKDADTSVTAYFENNNIVAIVDVDTRAVVRHIRSKGAMNAIISSEILDVEILKQKLAEVPSMEGLELSSTVSTKTAYTAGDENSKLRVALLDLGIKQNTIRCLNERGVFVKVFPYNSSFKTMEAFKPNGYLISNGPGDPAVMPGVVDTVTQIVEAGKPLFGICLGHQMLAESQGIKTYKMFNGHRGINHPVKNVITGRCEITSQNHGFAINEADVRNSSTVEITHLNLNDNTIEGIRVKGAKAFSVQYHPESAPGPHDSRYLFDDFVASL
ncbi:MAG: glutamine-hydrolyzing carbamoyl-phosphate synthase small subunit [Bacteroidia bacterium]|nr:glutamine-hydrolyzing carbamoyl-phosphate synthase small subunit [Bacteroidia bacterium]HQU99689.1 glutamine-hydrolyzing carbamoyl-phosphate synthase small subunit [Bacteroidia bacterium]